MPEVRKFGPETDGSYKPPSLSGSMDAHFCRAAFFVTAALITVLLPAALAQQTHPQDQARVTIEGKVLNSAGKFVGEASVSLEQEATRNHLETTADPAGIFAFTDLPPGHYLLRAEKSGQKTHGSVALALNQGERKHIELIIEVSANIRPDSSANSPTTTQPMEFTDKPDFTIAGVTDWTAVGGHGSDSALRTSEDLARETLTLKPDGSNHLGPKSPVSTGSESESESNLHAALARTPGSFEANHELGEFYFRQGKYHDSIPLLEAAHQIDPSNEENAFDLALAYEEVRNFSRAREYAKNIQAYKDSANLHRLLGELDEKLGDPLAAVQEYERAVHMDPSEQNYFAWGSELLLHRAVWQAAEVFRNGARLYPKSSRMLTAVGASLFAAALYNESALRLCDASDLNPTDPQPHIFMGKIETEAPAPLPCIEQKLSRFLQAQPESALANYLYAMAVWKRQQQRPDPVASQQMETLLTRTIQIDPNCADAYLQLGILYSSQHNYQKAIGFYTKAIEADPQSGEAHYRLGVAYDRTGEPAKAKTEFALHDEIEKQKAAAVERQRREIKQFLVVLQGQSTHPTPQ